MSQYALVSVSNTVITNTDRLRRGRRWAVACLAASALLLVGCGGKSSDTDGTTEPKSTTTVADSTGEFGWSMQPGAGWTESDPGGSQKLWMLAGGKASVNVLTEQFPAGTDIDLQGYLDAAIPQLSSYITDPQVVDTSFIDGDHHRLAVLDYTGTLESTFLYFRAIIAIDDAVTKAVIVTFATADQGTFDSEGSAVVEQAKSLQLS